MAIASETEERRAFVTLLLNDAYLPGALVLARSLRNRPARTPAAELVILYVKSALSDEAYNEIHKCGLFDRTISIDADVLETRNRFQLDHLLQRSELSETFSKLNVWRLVEYSIVVYLDSDTLVVGDVDDLFEFDIPVGGIGAASDAGWPDIFNSGVFVTRPDNGIYNRLLEFYHTENSFDGADQGLLNEFFNLQSQKLGTSWNRLPFVYNCTLNGNYEYLPAMVRFKDDVRVFHFIGTQKPWVDRSIVWRNQYPRIFGEGASKKNLYELWWDIYDELTSATTTLLEISGHLQPRTEVVEVPDHVDEQEEDANIAGQVGKEEPPVESSKEIASKVEDVSTIHFPTYYYKHNVAQPIVDESSKGEAWKLQESKVEWSHEEPVPLITIEKEDTPDTEYDAHVAAIERYVENNPIFPWEGKQVTKKPSRTFDNLNKFEPPSYSIAIMDSSASASSIDEEDDGDPELENEDRLMGFSSGHRFEQYLKRVEHCERPKETEDVADEAVENLEMHAKLDTVLQTDRKLEQQEDDENNLGEDRIRKCLDDLEFD